jgi:DNA-directed RNA polymerase specialized sigma24 family protein
MAGLDANAFGLLVKDCERTLYRVSRTVLPNDQDCADAVQEALSLAWRHIGFLREPRYFRTWLIRILLNECYRLLRRKKRPEAGAGGVGWFVADAPCDEAIDLRNALDALPEDQRAAIILYHVEDLTVEEIARVMKVPSGTVKSRLARARVKLAALMRPEED